MVSIAEYERLKIGATANRGSFVDHLLAIPPSEDESDEDEFPKIQVVPRDVEF